MTYERTPVTLTPEEMESIKTNLTALDTAISKYAVNLKSIERRRAYTIGVRALPFVELSLRLAEEFPQFGSTFFNLDKFKQDFTFYAQVKGLVEDLAPLLEKLEDSYMAVGTDAFAAARSYYDSTKAAAKANRPGAEAVAHELHNVYFRKKNSTTPSSSANDGTKTKRGGAKAAPPEAASSVPMPV